MVQVIHKAKRQLMKLSVPDAAAAAHRFLNFTADSVLDGIGSAEVEFQQVCICPRLHQHTMQPAC